MGILDTAVSGLLVSQRGLAVTGHNIANINTEGYSRQQIETRTRESNIASGGFIGNGAFVTNIRRVHDQFLTNQLRNSVSGVAEADAFLLLASRIDTMLGDEQTELNSGLVNFFNAAQDVADLPSSLPARQVMLSEAQSLTTRFQFMDDRLDGLSNEMRTQLDANIVEINSLVDGIAKINDRIVKAFGQSSGNTPNDLLDTRDKLIQDLAAFVSVSTVDQVDGSTNVFIGNGQPLVLGSVPSSMSVTESYRGHFDITLTSTFTTSVVSNNISGGSLGGILNFQSQMLEPTRNSLGRIALGLAETFNNQHELGLSLDGLTNLSFFGTGAPEVTPLNGAVNTITASITDATALTISDYSLVYNGADAYTLTRLSDGQVTNINTGGVSPFTTASVDGFNLNITAGAAVNDRYIVRPTINGAGGMTTLLSGPEKIAAAAVFRSEEATNASGLPINTGNAEISPVQISSTVGVPLAAPITLTFDGVLNQFNVSAPPGGTLAYNPATESAGKQFTLAAAGNATFTLSGVPVTGDQFIIENNTGASGDNQNALRLAALQTSTVLQNGTASYQETYGQLVADAGSLTRQNMISQEALGSLLQQASDARDVVSGVNLEEEAANMLKFQQAFQASAQLIATADTIFQSLLSSMR